MAGKTFRQRRQGRWRLDIAACSGRSSGGAAESNRPAGTKEEDPIPDPERASSLAILSVNPWPAATGAAMVIVRQRSAPVWRSTKPPRDVANFRAPDRAPGVTAFAARDARAGKPASSTDHFDDVIEWTARGCSLTCYIQAGRPPKSRKLAAIARGCAETLHRLMRAHGRPKVRHLSQVPRTERGAELLVRPRGWPAERTGYAERPAALASNATPW